MPMYVIFTIEEELIVIKKILVLKNTTKIET